MFRKRGRPPDPLPIGGYDKTSDEEVLPVPVHQWKRRDSYHCHLLGNWNQVWLYNKKETRATMNLRNQVCQHHYNMLITQEVHKRDF